MQTTNYQLILGVGSGWGWGWEVNYQMQTTEHKQPNANYQLPIHSWGRGAGKLPNANYQTQNYQMQTTNYHSLGGGGQIKYQMQTTKWQTTKPTKYQLISRGGLGVGELSKTIEHI